MKAKITSLFPIIDTVKNYRTKLAYADASAAIIVTLMLIPQSLAYALLAGLPPEVGLYSSILPLIAYAIFGTSTTLAVGPVAVISLMTGAAIASLSTDMNYSPAEIAVALSFLSGLLLLAMNLLKLGFIVNFLSRSVIEGFIMASSILIIVSQLKHIIGVDAHGHALTETLSSLYQSLGDTHIPTLIMGGGILACLLLARFLFKTVLIRFGVSGHAADLAVRMFPAFMVVISIVVMNFTAAGETGIRVVGHIPNGLPKFQWSHLDVTLFGQLFMPALLIAIIGYVESISVATRFALKTKTSVEPNQELLAMGASNIASSVSGGMPVTGGFSRSVVNFDAGAKTQLSGIMAAILIGLLASGLMTTLALLPKATLAAAIIVAVASLIDIKKLKETWLFSKYDFSLTAITIVTTLLAGVEIGVSVGIVLSIILHLYHTSKPHMAVVGLVPGTEHFRNVLRQEVETNPDIIGIRIDESLYFANAAYLEKAVVKQIIQSPRAKYCVLLFSSVNDIDASALESLESIHEKLKDMGVELHLSEVKGPVMDKLRTTRLYGEIKEHIHLSHYQAVTHLSGL
ncbi:Sulfate permease [hydrothermal vent metagenome]|uniref:Sulfate permease n=1 Tax=hydrothermal vent metagenome TaxID=652676 RepID=A0A3B0ZJR2_9ZZZZ